MDSSFTDIISYYCANLRSLDFIASPFFQDHNFSTEESWSWKAAVILTSATTMKVAKDITAEMNSDGSGSGNTRVEDADDSESIVSCIVEEEDYEDEGKP